MLTLSQLYASDVRFTPKSTHYILAYVRFVPIADIALGQPKMNRPPTEAAYLYLTTAVQVALLFAVLEVGHCLQLVLGCIKHSMIRIIAISIFRF